MRPRIEGATLPGFTATIRGDDGTPITDGADYTWECEASPKSTRVRQWHKTTGITSSASGFTVVWSVLDIGALTAGTNPSGTSYLLEFTGTRTSDSRVIKHHETVTIRPEITAT